MVGGAKVGKLPSKVRVGALIHGAGSRRGSSEVWRPADDGEEERAGLRLRGGILFLGPGGAGTAKEAQEHEGKREEKGACCRHAAAHGTLLRHWYASCAE